MNRAGCDPVLCHIKIHISKPKPGLCIYFDLISGKWYFNQSSLCCHLSRLHHHHCLHLLCHPLLRPQHCQGEDATNYQICFGPTKYFGQQILNPKTNFGKNKARHWTVPWPVYKIGWSLFSRAPTDVRYLPDSPDCPYPDYKSVVTRHESVCLIWICLLPDSYQAQPDHSQIPRNPLNQVDFTRFIQANVW